MVSGSSSVMTLILRSYLNRVSILFSPYLFTYPREMPRTLFFILCIGPPNVSKANFIEDFSSFVEGAALSCCENIILGDLNLHLDKQDGWSQKFNDSLCQYNFTQIIDSPTHIHGHILDVIFVRDAFLKAVCTMVTAGLSDHLAITFKVNIPIKAPCKFRQVNTRKIHKINITDFREDILNSDLTSSHNSQFAQSPIVQHLVQHFRQACPNQEENGSIAS